MYDFADSKTILFQLFTEHAEIPEIKEKNDSLRKILFISTERKPPRLLFEII